MDQKKALRIWASLSSFLFLITFFTNWANHPEVLALFNGNALNVLFLLGPMMGLGWVIRSKIHRLSNPWLDQFSCVFLLSYLVPLFQPTVRSSNGTAIGVWSLAVAASMTLGLVLFWEMIMEKVRKNAFLRKVPVPAALGLFAVACVAIAFFKGWEGRYVLPVLGLAPLARYYLARKDPEVLKAFALFLGTDVLYADWPAANEPKGLWSAAVILHHLLLSGLVFVYWEKLKTAGARKLLGGLLLFAILPMFPYYSHGFGNFTWPLQVLLLGMVLAWDPWLKGQGKGILLGLGSVACFGLFDREALFTVIALVLASTMAVSQLRLQWLKLPQKLIRTLALFTLSGLFYSWYERTSGPAAMSGSFLLAGHLGLSGLLALFWEKFREGKDRWLHWVTALYVVLPLPVAIFHHSWLWVGHVLVLALVWFLGSGSVVSAPAGRKGPSASSRTKPLSSHPLAKKFSPLFLALRKVGETVWKRILLWGREPKVRKGALGIVGLVLIWMAGSILYKSFTTHIVSFTPQGVLASPDTVLRAKFSGEVSVTGKLEEAFRIDPPLPGSVRLEDSTTLVFTPSAPLRAATTYKVRLRTSGLKAKKYFLQGSAKTSFSTEPLKVVSNRLFYNFDMVKGTEKELMGELEFNYPVQLERLKEKLTVARGHDKLTFEVEQGTLPSRFFFRAGGFEREKAEQTLTVSISPDLSCVDCGKPLGTKFEATTTLPAKPKLEVGEIKLMHVPGTTLISVLFTLPVSPAQVRNAITIEPSVPFKVDTEYCYAVLKAEFQPNTDYKIKVAKGLRAISGEALEEGKEQTLRLEDVRPYVKFADPGRFLSLEGGKIVAVKTMNLDSYRISVEKVFRNNIANFLRSRSFYSDSEYGSTYGMGSDIFNGQVTVTGGQINQEVETALDFGKWHKAPYKGLFVVSLYGNNDGGRDSRSFLCTDIGLMMKRSGNDLWVQALSISKLTPLPEVHLQLLSNNNQMIQEKDTDAEGRAWFRNWKNNPYNFQPLAVVASKDDDWSFLRFEQSPLDQARFDVGGDPFLSEGWDAFLTSERGLYRPGEDAYFTAVVRHADMEIPTDLPVNLVIRDTGYNEVAKFTTTLQAFGMATFKFPIPEDSATGQMTAELGLENGVHLATTNFKVEEFIPDKIKVEVKTLKKGVAPGEALAYKVAARQLFGAPGADLKVRSWVKLIPQEFTDKKWKGFHFSDPTRPFTGEKLKAPDGTTDSSGSFDVQLPVPASLLPPSMLKAVVYAEVMDTGGRPVGANAFLDVHRYPYYLGLKCLEGREAGPQTPVHIKYIAVTPDGDPTKVKKVLLMVKRKVWYSIFKRSGWFEGGYESGSYEQVTQANDVDVDGQGSFTFTPDKPGEYTIYLGNEESMRTSIKVVVSGPGASGGDNNPSNLEDPGKLSMTLHQAVYKAGEAPRLEVRAPFAGRLLVSLEREKVFSTLSLNVTPGLNVVDLPPVTAEYQPNVYVVGLLVRKPEESLRTLPMAAFGVVPLAMDCSGNEISFKWKAPESVKSKQGIDVSLSTGAPGAKVVLSAVDEGILQIISFTTPDPFKYFYRKRGLSTLTYTLFEEILPDLARKFAVGGDEGEGFAGRHLNPIATKRVKSFALFSGILTAGPDGVVNYHFPADKFHGEARVMALGVEHNRFGASAFHVKVADSVVVDPSFPRFLAPGDHFDVPVLLYNNTKAPSKVTLTLSGSGPVAVDGEKSMEVALGAGGQKQVLFHAKALTDAGKAVFKVEATDATGESYGESVELPVRPGNPLTTSIKFGALSGKGTTTLSVPGGFISQGQRVRLAVSSSPLLTYLGSLDHLIGYPHGCAEQITSKAFPLLYFKEAGLLTGRFSDHANAVEVFVQDAVDQLNKLQRADGGFSLWPSGQESEDYLSNYVSHFLIEAQKLGYKVNQGVLDKLQNRLGVIQVRGQGRLDRRQQNIELPESSYILYLKALAGKPDLESMAAFKADLKDRGVTEKCLLSLAYSTLGDRATALSILPPKYLPSALQRQLNGEWFSPNKEMALYLMALTGANPTSKEIPALLTEFGKRLKTLGYFGTTQEESWCFMAIARAVKATTEASPLSAQWSLKGEVAHPLAGESALVKDTKLSGKEVELKNLGDKELYYHLIVEGTLLASKKETVSNGLSVRREYRDEKGATVNLGSVAQGQLVVVTLWIKSPKMLDNLVLVDLLPAGFEVDNPRLSSRGKLGFDPACNFSPAAMDFRDDRVLLYSENLEGEQAFSYSVRAVTPGAFQVPGLTAEAMYDPEVYARTNTGETLVVAPTKH